MADKLKIALYWAASCGGCEIAVLDTDERILEIIEAADIVFWPVAVDTKYADVEKMEDGSIDVCFFNGAVRSSEQEHLAKLLRAKSKVMVAFGACAVSGGIPGLANLSDRAGLFETSYLDDTSTSNPDGTVPLICTRVEEGELTLPELYDTVKALDQVVDVDYYLPGCPPPPDLIMNAVGAIVSGQLPPKGAVLAPEKTVCDECRHEKTEKSIGKLKRIYEVEKVEEECLLGQGILCMGPATRGGCDARCLDADMPCTGCGGPAPGATDQGAKMISGLGSILGLEGEESMDPDEVKAVMDDLRDVVGTFYKYTLPSSLINRRVRER